MRLRNLGVVGVLLIAPACQPPPLTSLDEMEVAAVRAMTEEWLDAHRARDWDTLAQHYTEDAVLMPPMARVVTGRESIRRWFEANEHDTRVGVTILEIVGYADLAYVRGTSMVTIGVSTETPITFPGKYLDIRRRQSDGSWLIAVDMFSPDAPIE